MIEKLKRALSRKHQPPPGPKPPISGPGVRCVAKYGAPNTAMHLPFADIALWPDTVPIIMMSGCNWSASGGGQRPVRMCQEWQRGGCAVAYYFWREKGPAWSGGVLLLRPDQIYDYIEAVKGRPGVLIGTLPEQGIVNVMDLLHGAGWTTVYDVIDDWEAFHESGDMAHYDRDMECRLMADADVVTASARLLTHKVRDWTGREAVLVPNGGPAKPVPDCPRPEQIVLGDAGTCAYCGWLCGGWFDWDLLLRTALEMPDVAFNIIGAVDGRHHDYMAPNIHYHGELPYPTALTYLKHCDVGLIPFRLDGISEAVDPIKWYDYIACGLRVVATGCLTELAGRKGGLVADRDAESLSPWIEAALAEGPVRGVRRYLQETCWWRRSQELLAAAGVRISNPPERE